jgi:hypothetical protein
MSKRDSLIHIAGPIVKTLEINLLHIDSESAESG